MATRQGAQTLWLAATASSKTRALVSLQKTALLVNFRVYGTLATENAVSNQLPGDHRRCTLLTLAVDHVEPAVNMTSNYAGQIFLQAPSDLGTHSIRMYDEVECVEPRPCAEVVEEKPDTIVVNGTMVGSATSAEIRTAIAQIVNEQEANIIVWVYPCGGGQLDCFTLQATVLPSTSNITEQAAMVTTLQVSARNTSMAFLSSDGANDMCRTRQHFRKLSLMLLK